MDLSAALPSSVFEVEVSVSKLELSDISYVERSVKPDYHR